MPRFSFATVLSSILVGTTLAFACAGCRSTQPAAATPTPAAAPSPPMQPAPATPIAEKKQELGSDKTWNPQWDALIESQLPADLLSPTAARAVRSYCPRFAEASEAEKRAFWAYVFQALAGAEAGLDPTSDVHHAAAAVNRRDPVTSRLSHQEGLLQLKYEDASRYGCDFDWQHDRTLPEKDPGRTILQPSRNLSCGIRIMENQIVTQGKPLLSRSSYWSTLQPGTVSYRVFAKQMTNVPEACGLRERHRPASRKH